MRVTLSWTKCRALSHVDFLLLPEDILPASSKSHLRPTDASEMAKRWFKLQDALGPSLKAATRFGSSSHSLLCAPRKWGRKSRFKNVLPIC
jgi:hypothetical protein